MPPKSKRQRVQPAARALAKASDDDASDADVSDREDGASLANKYMEGDLKIGDSISVDAQDMICPNVQIVAIEPVRTIASAPHARERAHTRFAHAHHVQHVARARR